MTRVKNWEKNLKTVIEKHMVLPSQFGVSDCYLIPDDAVEAVTGSRMYPKAIGYKSEAGAAKKLRQHGFENVEQAFASKFEEIPTSLAQRGDVGVVEVNGIISGGVFTALGFMTRGETSVIFVPYTEVKKAFKVV